jgi:hypothetical protein
MDKYLAKTFLNLNFEAEVLLENYLLMQSCETRRSITGALLIST